MYGDGHITIDMHLHTCFLVAIEYEIHSEHHTQGIHHLFWIISKVYSTYKSLLITVKIRLQINRMLSVSMIGFKSVRGIIHRLILCSSK